MAVDWSALIEKKQRLGKALPGMDELALMEASAADVFQIPVNSQEGQWATCLGYGARTKSLVVPCAGVPHRFQNHHSQVVLKLFRGPAKEYLLFHEEWFRTLEVVVGRDEFQQSIEAGVNGRQSYAVLEYVDGATLRESLYADCDWTAASARQVLSQLIVDIWIPTWDYGLRFKDCHPGNFVVRSDNDGLVMIDVEQMRKSVFERMTNPDSWEVRDKHQASALSRLPNLVCHILHAWQKQYSEAGLRRVVVKALDDSGLPICLGELGRTTCSPMSSSAFEAFQHFCDRLRSSELF